MAAWIAMTQDHQLAQQVAVSKLREQCRDKLCELVNPPTGGQQDPHENERIHELRCVVPKIVFAIEALTQFDTSRDAVAELRQRLLKARRDDGSWDFIVQGDATPGNCFVTSLVLRTIATDRALSDAEQCARHYLEKKQSDIKSLCERLYVLNSLAYVSYIHQEPVSASRKIKRDIKRTLNDIYRSVRENPTALPNPFILDFHHHERTRYFRVSTDLLLLESLTLLSGPWLLFLRAHAGRRIADHFFTSLATTGFGTDTSGHRASTGSALFASRLLKLISGRGSVVREITFRLFGWAACVLTFGPNFTWNVIATLAAGTVAAILHWCFNQDIFAMAFVGVALKALVDAGKGAFDASCAARRGL